MQFPSFILKSIPGEWGEFTGTREAVMSGSDMKLYLLVAIHDLWSITCPNYRLNTVLHIKLPDTPG